MSELRRSYHVGRADFLQRVRSRRLLVVLAVVAYLGYQVNVGGIELAYQIEQDGSLTNVHGTNTAPFIGLKAGMTGAAILLFVGFYLAKGAVGRDREHRVDQLVASTAVSDPSYLFGKWLSNVGLGAVVLTTLAVATVVNHAVNGVGPTEPLALVGPVYLFGLPVAALVGGVALLFESVPRLSGTGGNVAYFLLMPFTLTGVVAIEGTLPSAVPTWAKAVDLLGHLAVYELTADALMATVPEFGGTFPSVGTLDGDISFRYDGAPWPAWVFLQRAGLLLPALAVTALAAIPLEQYRPNDSLAEDGTLSRLADLLPSIRGNDRTAEEMAGARPVDSPSLTPVEDRDAGGFGRLVAAELRLAVRGRRWWWYAGAVGTAALPLALLGGGGSADGAVATVRTGVVPVATLWPIFVWSDVGVRATRHRVTELILSSRYPLRQVLAEWLAGVAVGAAVASGAVFVFVATGEAGALLGVAAAAVFAPSLAAASGAWSRSPWLFEIGYLLLWYAGPLNGATAVDFAGTTAASVETGVPLVFLAASVPLVCAALLRRKLAIQ